jgi:hypothetical protein
VEGRSILDNVFIAQKALSWAEESNQDLVLLLLDFEKAFDRIEWGFLFTALEKFGFGDTWIRWVKALYKEASSAVKMNGETGLDFQLARSVRQGCPLAPYLFILATDVLGYMLADPIHEVEGLSLRREVSSETRPSRMTRPYTSKGPPQTWTKPKKCSRFSTQPPARRSTGTNQRPFGPARRSGPGNGEPKLASNGFRTGKAQGT